MCVHVLNHNWVGNNDKIMQVVWQEYLYINICVPNNFIVNVTLMNSNSNEYYPDSTLCPFFKIYQGISAAGLFIYKGVFRI